MHLPVSIGDFTDFSCSKEHVLNAGEAIMKKRFLPPGFLHFPVGYTGRTSSIIPSGTPVTRPKGQFRDAKGEVIYGATRQLDYELEVGCIVGKPSALGDSIAVNNADEHIFGLVLLNDWSGKCRIPFLTPVTERTDKRSSRHSRLGNDAPRSLERQEFLDIYLAMGSHA